MTNIGKCALCFQERQELQDSHFLPAGVYRVTRDETQDNPNPIIFNDNAVFQTSKQVTAFLLCRSCEVRLNKNGEDWFLKYCSRKDKFLMHSLVQAARPEIVFPKIKIYHAAKLAQINVAALSYFALSMFWRASVRQWQLCGVENRGIKLGPYEERLRKYLLGETAFPQDCVLWVSIPAHVTAFCALSLTPYGSRKVGHHLYKFLARGVGFQLFVGKQIPEENRHMCFVNTNGNPIYQTDMLEEGITNDVLYKFTLNPELAKGPK